MASSRHGLELDRPKARPHSSRHDTRQRLFPSEIPARSSLGQFSLGPTTQTTVVTTTTTTTTNFPPFLMRDPLHANELDPKQYPLAAAPTPPALKKICFSLDGKPIVFREATDTSIAVEQIEQEVEQLRKENGVVRLIQSSEPLPFIKAEDQPSPSAQLLQGLNERPASPESIAESDQPIQQEATSPARSTRSRRTGKQKETIEHQLKSHPRIRQVQSTNPTTPEMQNRSSRSLRRNRQDQSMPLQTNSVQGILPSPDTEQQDLSLRRERSPLIYQQSLDDEAPPTSSRRRNSRTLHSRASHDSVVPTPPIEQDDIPPLERALAGRTLSSIPARLHVSESPSIQDGTLPSPSLSPVTAAANTQHSEYFADIESSSEAASHHRLSFSNLDNVLDRTPSRGGYDSPAATDPGDLEETWSVASQFNPGSMTDIPAMLNFFEALPDDLKSYVMHQMLRRCPKSTLHVIADAVNPALKCDFLTILPPELALNILSYLDVRSLCRASQVSKKWRQMVNSDEKAWKELFDTDGFSLPEGELQRAISQGWGWQDPHGIEGREVDMSYLPVNKTDSEPGSPGPSTMLSRKGNPSTTLRRSKRKAATQLTNRSKMIKRQYTSREVSADFESVDWMSQISTAEGPYNAANAAALAVPNPELPIPTLKGLHLYKSLYRRHHLIRRNWMFEDTKPHHIAFRAHDSHVVTCLQFDTDKILTGSDDNNINVYDTKTGRLRKLLRGHEGGVWALQYVGNTLVSGSTDRSVRVWDIEKGVETQVFRGHTSTVRCLQILQPTKVGETAEGKDITLPRYPLIITGSRDSTLRIWKLPRPSDQPYIQSESDADTDESPYFVRTLIGHQHSVRAIAAHADTLVSGSYDCSVRVWKISTGETIHRLQGHAQKVYSVVLDHERNRCISGSMDNLVKIWSLDTGSALYTLEGHSSLVGLLDLNNDRLVSAAADSTLRIWDPENGQCKATLSAHTGAITCFQHDAQKVISGSDRTLKMWNIKTGECMKDLLSDLSGVWQVKFNERRCVAAVQRDNMTFIEVLDFGAARDGISDKDRGRRIIVDEAGRPIQTPEEVDAAYLD